MNTMTSQELKTLFHSCSLDLIHLDQGKVPKFNGQYVTMHEVVAVNDASDRRMLLSSIRKLLKNRLRRIKNKTRQAYTYGGSFFTNPDGKFCLALSLGVAQKDIGSVTQSDRVPRCESSSQEVAGSSPVRPA